MIGLLSKTIQSSSSQIFSTCRFKSQIATQTSSLIYLQHISINMAANHSLVTVLSCIVSSMACKLAKQPGNPVGWDIVGSGLRILHLQWWLALAGCHHRSWSSIVLPLQCIVTYAKVLIINSRWSEIGPHTVHACLGSTSVMPAIWHIKRALCIRTTFKWCHYQWPVYVPPAQ